MQELSEGPCCSLHPITRERASSCAEERDEKSTSGNNKGTRKISPSVESPPAPHPGAGG